MKYIIMFLSLILSVIILNGQESYNPTPIRNKILYWTYNNVTTNLPTAADSICIITPSSDTNAPWNFDWNTAIVTNPPDYATINAISQEVADGFLVTNTLNLNTEKTYELTDEAKMLKAVIYGLKQANPQMNLPDKAVVIQKYKQLKGE